MSDYLLRLMARDRQRRPYDDPDGLDSIMHDDRPPTLGFFKDPSIEKYKLKNFGLDTGMILIIGPAYIMNKIIQGTKHAFYNIAKIPHEEYILKKVFLTYFLRYQRKTI